jgi:glycosyltransferase involved in cell wall biosynthesis
VAIAETVLDSFQSVYGYRDIPLIPNGIPLDAYSSPTSTATAWRHQNGFEAGQLLFVCVARLDPQKNHAMLIASFAEGFRENPDAHLLIVGRDTEHSETLKAAARLTGAGDRIHFLGVRSDVPDILHSSDVFVLASDYEGNPLTVMEAMAAGLPVVATSVGGVPELVVPDETGLLVEPGDGQAMARTLRLIADQPAMRQLFGEAGKTRALENFSAEAMAEEYAGLYESLLRGSGAYVVSRST